MQEQSSFRSDSKLENNRKEILSLRATSLVRFVHNTNKILFLKRKQCRVSIWLC